MPGSYELRSYPISHAIFANILTFVFYFISGQLGILAAVPGTNVTPLWPPSGIALAAILIFGYRVIPAIFLGSFLIQLSTTHLLAPNFPVLSIVFVGFATGIGASLQAAVGNFLIRIAISENNLFEDALNVVHFSASSLISCLVNATVGSLALTLSQITSWPMFSTVWTTWWVGDVAGIIVITPLILIWKRPFHFRITLGKVIECFALLITISIVTYFNIGFNNQMKYLFLPVLTWAAIRFGFHGVTAGNFIVSVILTLLTVSGYLWFTWEDAPFHENLFFFALFIAIVMSTVLVITAEINKGPKSTIKWDGSTSITSWPSRGPFRRWFKK